MLWGQATNTPILWQNARKGDCIMNSVKRLLAIIVAVVATASAAGVTVHRSFRGGYPAAVSEARQNSAAGGAQVGVVRSAPDAKAVAGKKLVGKVTRVSDGDTIWVTDAAGKHKIRLNKIDAPESDQPYGKESAAHLKSLIGGKTVRVEYTSTDQYGRILGVVYLSSASGMVDVNLTMVKNGCAWHYSYHDNTPAYAAAEKEARQNRRGLWAAESPINPYQWRKSRRNM